MGQAVMNSKACEPASLRSKAGSRPANRSKPTRRQPYQRASARLRV